MFKEILPGMMKYCVIGNITKEEHVDEEGNSRQGTKVFPPGRKVYLSRRIWKDEIVVLGLNRYKTGYALDLVPLDFIENIRFSKSFNPKVLAHMVTSDEYMDMWWSYQKEDEVGARNFTDMLIRIQAGETELLEAYYRDVMYQFYGVE
ncbi:hypothetical protein [Pseudobutyrivibrio sp.]|uniref:hypothetical protein n=1 Tax=Pseudobutyrivibrio sp. TaxID=2014367 RepID=UPI003865734B